MMRSMIQCAVLAVAVAFGATTIGCTADVHDNTVNVDDVAVEFETTADVDNIQAGTPVPVTINVENGTPVPPEQEPPPEHADDAVYFEFHLDDSDNAALLVTAELSVSVMIPAETPPGDHKLVCKVKKHDGSDSGEFEMDIKVRATVD